MDRYVISAPRSGLNWVRFCVEYFLGVRTAGKELLVPKTRREVKAFFRSNDAHLLTKNKSKGGFNLIDPAATDGDKVSLLLRDPLETYVRMAGGRMRVFELYLGNIRFFLQAAATDKYVAYYDDIVSDPAKMTEYLEFLDIEPAEGFEKISADRLKAGWAQAGLDSRNLYGQNQRHGGGSKTRNTPLDFNFHQKKLSDARKHKVWRYLIANLSEEELALLDRYRMNVPVLPPTFFEKITGQS
jgi:hypothetical protein